MKCDYCGGEAILKDSRIIYKTRSYGSVYVCENYPACDAYVGAHDYTFEPKGSLANAELRELRKQCHEVFDELWMEKKRRAVADRNKLREVLSHIPKQKTKRQRAYKWLAEFMGLEVAHIGEFDVEQCKKLLSILTKE